MKFTWLSNSPWSPTGYGNQTKVFLPRFVERGHEVASIAFFGLEGGMLAGWNGIPVYPKFIHAYGQDVMIPHTKFHGTKIMFSLMDAWVIETHRIPHDIAWVPWFPVDSDPLSPRIYEAVKQAHARIVFSKFGVEKMNEVGLDHYYVPHGVDTQSSFYPEDMAECREKLGWPQDKFIVGMVAANKGNPSRKAFEKNIEAFALLKKKHPDVMLYLHTMKLGFQGVDLPEFINAMGLKEGEDVLFPSEYHLSLGFPDMYMRTLYSAMDTHLLVSMGEGFGIPIVEAQACGTPVIVGDWTSMSELCFSGWKVPKSEAQPTWTPLATYQYSPNVNAIYELLEQAYNAKGSKKYRERARDGALEYDADAVMDKYWAPVLEEIEESTKAVVNRASIGVYDRKGAIHVPSLEPDDPSDFVVYPDGTRELKADGFGNEVNGVTLDIEDDPDSAVSKVVMWEIRNDYDLDSIPFEEGDVVVDIGAHVGVVSIYLAKKYGVECYAYEPVKENYDRLLGNIEGNEVEEVYPKRLAVTGDGRDIKIQPTKGNSGGANIYGEGVEVPSTTLEQIMDSVGGKVKLLKIDCEGAEYEIIEANPEVLKNVEYVRGEVHPMKGKSQQALIELIHKYVPKGNVNLTVLGANK
jgi:FkbM family methyltransferase